MVKSIAQNKIVLLSAFSIDSLHGSESFTGYKLVEQAVEKFKKTILVTSDRTESVLLEVLSEKFKNKIEIHVIPVRSHLWLKNALGFYPLYRQWQKDFGKFLVNNQIQFDLGIVANLGTFLFGSGFSLYTKPYIFGPAGFSSFHLSYARAYGWKSIIEISRELFVYLILVCDRFVRQSLNKATWVITSDKKVQTLLRRLFPKANIIQDLMSHAVIPNYRKKELQSKFVNLELIWTGRFISRKDPLLALEVFTKIFEVLPNAKLTMIGEGKLRAKLERYIEIHDLSSAVNLTGWIEKNEVLQYMRGADLMLFTSFRETAGVQIFECISSGTMVLALPATGISNWYKHNLIEFLPVTFFESRKSLIKRFAFRALELSDNSQKSINKPVEDRTELNLMEDILLKTLFARSVKLKDS